MTGTKHRYLNTKLRYQILGAIQYSNYFCRVIQDENSQKIYSLKTRYGLRIIIRRGYVKIFAESVGWYLSPIPQSKVGYNCSSTVDL